MRNKVLCERPRRFFVEAFLIQAKNMFRIAKLLIWSNASQTASAFIIWIDVCSYLKHLFHHFKFQKYQNIFQYLCNVETLVRDRRENWKSDLKRLNWNFVNYARN